jgi:pyruvate-formate lyase-activating enzyme
MECDLVYADLKGFVPSQYMQVENVHIDRVSTTVVRALILNQQDNLNGLLCTCINIFTRFNVC